MMFSNKHKKKFGIAWGILSGIIILSMVALYLPGLFS